MMAQARKEPRFADLEVFAPEKSAGTSMRVALANDDVSDADFETVYPAGPGTAAVNVSQQAPYGLAPGLGLLRHHAPLGAPSLESSDQLSPRFLAATMILGLTVFWLCGGHALLY